MDTKKSSQGGSGVQSGTKSIECDVHLTGELPPIQKRPPKTQQKIEIEFSKVRDLSYEDAKKEIDVYISKCSSEPSVSSIAGSLRIDIDMVTRVVLARKIPTNDNVAQLGAHYIKKDEFPADNSSKKEADPTGRKAHDPGAKLDSGKVLAGVLGDFSLALNAVAEIGTYGVNKYSRGGWEHVPDAQTRYTDALWRHLLAESTEPIDQESGLTHQAHLAWNILAILELELRSAGKTKSGGMYVK